MAPRLRLAVAGVAAAALGAGILAQVFPHGADESDKPALGLVTSLPIYWPETVGITETLDGQASEHWARTALESEYRLVPIDTLDGQDLGKLDRLIMAQPRPLSPAENVALDNWVRGGGRVLLFADPFLTEHSRYLLGDKRRPQDLVMLSPILRRWGLELRFDEDQSEDERDVPFESARIPVQLAGTFAKVDPGPNTSCELSAVAVIARCRIGKGEALLVADAALLDHERAAAAPFAVLIETAFSR